MATFSLYTDGGARGNPGPAAGAAILFNESGQLLAQDSKYLGIATNNMAEYEALLMGLKLAVQNNANELKVYMDSELIVMQMNGAYRVKEKRLKVLWEKAKMLKEKFADIKFVHVRREKNSLADALVNEVLDNNTG